MKTNKKLFGIALIMVIAILLGIVPSNTVYAATFTVTRLDDPTPDGCLPGDCSLREAITDANASVGSDVIEFSVAGIINVLSQLPALSDISGGTIIDGTTAPGYINAPLVVVRGPGINSFDGFEITSANNEIHALQIDSFNVGVLINGVGASGNVVEGSYIGNVGIIAVQNIRGIRITDGSNNLIGSNGDGINDTNERNVISGNVNSNVLIEGDQNKVSGNYIGIDATGTQALQNEEGVSIDGNFNIIGGNTPGERNVISGNYDGIMMTGSSNVVSGNYIGTDATGSFALGNEHYGIYLSAGDTGGSNNTIGGTSIGAGNVISGNNRGIRITGRSYGLTNTIIQGNFIGTDATGTIALANTVGGMLITTGANNTLIGGADPNARNVISGNQRHGIWLSRGSNGNIVQGNFIGTDVTGTLPLGNELSGVYIQSDSSDNVIGGNIVGAGNLIAYNGESGILLQLSSSGDTPLNNVIQSNSIHSNAALGINLSDALLDGVTPNDLGDSDVGTNNFQNYPVITSAMNNATNTVVDGTLNSTANTTFTVQFFSNTVCDPSGYGEGETYLDTISVTTDGNGDAAFSTTLSTLVSVSQLITTTATDPDNNTSEFSTCAEILLSPVTFIVTRLDDPTPDGCQLGDCSLREAITDANGIGGTNTIELGPGTHLISTSGLPVITSTIIINGNGATIARDFAVGTPEFYMFYVEASGDLTLNNVTVTNGSLASGSGSAVYNLGSVTINDSTFTANQDSAIWSLSVLNINNSLFTNNSGLATILNRASGLDATGTISNSTISNNFTTGIRNDGTLVIDNSLIDGNSVTDGGRGGGIISYGELYLTNSTVSNNSAERGGGIYAQEYLEVSNSTISGNHASDPLDPESFIGGGIYIHGTFSLSNSTVWGNSSSTGGAGLHIRISSGDTVQIKNTIVGGSTSGLDCDMAGSSFIALNSIDTDGSCLTEFGSGFTTTDPLLETLQDNGGATFTHALLAGSPAIDAVLAGQCTTVTAVAITSDQRGVSRPLDGDGDSIPLCDIGAYEFTPPVTFIVTRLDDPTPDGCQLGDCSLREAITDANGIGGTNIIELGTGTHLISLSGLPVITSTIIINGNGATIARDFAVGTPEFYMFYVEASGDLTLNNVTVTNGDLASGRGSAVYSLGSITINDSIFTANQDTAIWSWSVLNINNSQFTNNSGYATILNRASGLDATGTISNSIISNNTGRGIRNDGILIIDNSLIDGNTIDPNSGNGGGIDSHGELYVTNSTVSNNIAEQGAGISAREGYLEVSNSTISGNTATLDPDDSIGGGIYVVANFSLSNSTIWGNSSSRGGAGLHIRISSGDIVQIKNTIVGGSPSGLDCDMAGSGFSSVNSIDTDGSCLTEFGSGFTTTDPLLETLQNNGGATFTHALQLGSPAIDAVPAGQCTTVTAVAITSDQRGVSRPLDGDGDSNALCDIGAYEAPTDDGDGVSPETEDGAPNDGDGNLDGTPDSEQENVTSLPNTVDAEYVTLVSPASTSFTAVSAIVNPSPGDAPVGVDFPIGFLEYTVENITPGGGVTVTLIAPAGTVFTTYYKYGPTPSNPTPHWYEFLYDGTTGAVISGSQMTLYFVDGQRGDDDLSANGQIVEPGGPAEFHYQFTGFFNPVDGELSVNEVRAGRSIPIKFSLGGDYGLDIFVLYSPSSFTVANGCTGQNIISEEVTETAGNSTLSYDPIDDQYTYIWQTEREWAGTCRQFGVQLNDGTNHVAWFDFR